MRRLFAHSLLALVVAISGSGFMGAYAEPLDLTSAPEPHPNVDPSVCPVCAKILAGLREGKYTKVLVKEPSDVTKVKLRLNSMGVDLPILVKRSSNPAVGLGKLDAAPSRVTVILDLPVDVNELRAIHGDNAVGGEASIRSMRRIQTYADNCTRFKGRIKELRNLKARDLPETDGPEICDRVRANIKKQTSDELTIVIGHINEEGLLVLHDGSKVALAELKAEGTTWVFGCRTADFPSAVPGLGIETTAEIGYVDAIGAADKVVHAFARGGKFSSALKAVVDGKTIATTSVIGGVIVTELNDASE